ncbi:MAG: PorV/PorQ family protein [Elusimicrobiaceae bacterium]
MKHTLLFLALAVFCVPFVKAGGAGTTAASFLKIDPSARSAALSGAVTAIADDDAALFNYNPASAAGIEQKQVSFTHTEWVINTRLEALSYAQPLSETLTLGAAFNLLHTGSVGKTDENGNYLGDSFRAMDGSLSLGLANRFSKNVVLGGALKGVRQSMDSKNASALAGDIGAIVQFERFSLGASLNNFGSDVKLNDDSSPLPRTVRGGFTVTPLPRLLLAFAADKAMDANTICRFGVEYSIRDIITGGDRYDLRAGYKSGSAENTGPGFSIGVGLKIKSLGLNYSFVPMGDLGSANRISMSFSFGEKRKPPQLAAIQ